MSIESVAVVGTGLIGTSVALALRRAGFAGELTGVDRSERERADAAGSFDRVMAEVDDAAAGADAVVLATPVLGILDAMERMAGRVRAGQLVTDVGSTKGEIARRATVLYGGAGRAAFLPGHPMAGKERGGAAMGDAALFDGAMWLFTPVGPETEQSAEWREWVGRMGARTRDMEAAAHDEVCAWVSHLPQFLSTALAALLEERFGGEGMEAVQAIGGRALRETTRLGASPYSMWRDVAMTNGPAISETLQALEQRLQHLRENLRTPELREEFGLANAFRRRG